MFSGFMFLYLTISVLIAAAAATKRALDDFQLPEEKIPGTSNEADLDSFEIWEGIDTWSIIDADEPIPDTTTVAPTPEPMVNEAIVITKSLLHIPYTRLADIHEKVIREVPGTTYTEKQTQKIIFRVMAPGVVPLWFHEILTAFPGDLDYKNDILIQVIVSWAPPEFPKFRNHQLVQYLARNWIKYCINASAISDDPEPCKLRKLSSTNDTPVMVLCSQMLRAYLRERIHLEEDFERRKRERE